MRKLTLFLIVCALSLCLGAQSTSIYNFTMKSIDGKDVNLADYKGKVVMLSTSPASAASPRNTNRLKQPTKSTRTRAS